MGARDVVGREPREEGPLADPVLELPVIATNDDWMDK